MQKRSHFKPISLILALPLMLATVPAHRVSSTPGRVVHVLGMQITIPKAWTVGSAHTVDGTTGVAFDGPRATLVLTRTDAQAQNLLPLAGQEATQPERSPYVVSSLATLNNTVTANAAAIASTTQMYGLTLTLPSSERTLAQKILASWRHPQVISTTKAVHHLLKTSDVDPQRYELSFIDHHQRGWVLVSGQPATAQQSWFLFATKNAGKTWVLRQHTSWVGPPTASAFLNSVGVATIKRVSTRVGLIVESSGFVDGIEVWRTDTYGRTWHETSLKLPWMSSATLPPKILVRDASPSYSGTISIQAYEMRAEGGTQSRTWISHNQGQTWALESNSN